MSNKRKKMVVFHLANMYNGQFFRVKQNVAFFSQFAAVDTLEIRIRFPLPLKWINKGKKAEWISSRHITLPIQCPWLGRVTKLWDAFWGAVISFFLIYLFSPDLVLCETDFTSRYAMYVKKFKRSTLVMADFHGAAAEEYRFTNPKISQEKIDYVLDQRRSLCEHADIIICQSGEMVIFLKSLMENKKQIFCYPMTIEDNWRISLDDIKEKRRNLREKLHLNESHHIFIYTGGLTKWQKIDVLLRIFEKYHARYPDSILLFFSTAEDTSWVPCEYYDLLHSEAMRIRSVTHAEIADYLCVADIAFLIRDDILLNRVASPTKFGEYLSRGLPIITGSVAKHWGPDDYDFNECFVFEDEYDDDEALIEGIHSKLMVIDNSLRQRIIYYAWHLYGEKENDERLKVELEPYFNH